MKITVNINIGGYPFIIDEDAYSELKKYLDNLENHFSGDDNSDEIIADIESRIAELFRARLGNDKQVVNMDDVLHIMSVVGTPESISDEENTNSHQGASFGQRRLFRDPHNRMIGGVCSGMAIYWNTDPTLIRVIFIALTLAGGAGALLYLLLYIFVPEAKTASQRSEMYGEPLTIHNIKRNIKNEFKNIKKNMKL